VQIEIYKIQDKKLFDTKHNSQTKMSVLLHPVPSLKLIMICLEISEETKTHIRT